MRLLFIKIVVFGEGWVGGFCGMECKWTDMNNSKSKSKRINSQTDCVHIAEHNTTLCRVKFCARYNIKIKR